MIVLSHPAAVATRIVAGEQTVVTYPNPVIGMGIVSSDVVGVPERPDPLRPPRPDQRVDAMSAHPFRRVAVAVILSVPALLAAPAPVGAADAYQPARCAWMAPYLAEFGLPVATFQRIAWRESGCAFRAPCVSTRTDLACSRFGLNFKGSLAARWRALCGARSHLDTRWFAVDMTCARKAYERMGLAPWR